MVTNLANWGDFMKKLICLLMFAMLMTSCGLEEAGTAVSDVSDVKPNISKCEPEVVNVIVDRILYENIEDLKAKTELVVIGEFLEDSKQQLVYSSNDNFNKSVLTDAVSTNTVKIEKVLYGDCSSDTLVLSQRYGITDDTNQLVTFSDMTPMNKGDKWIFFLYFDEVSNSYWCSGDYTGRYPLPDEKILSVCSEVSEILEERSSWITESLEGSETGGDRKMSIEADGKIYHLTKESDVEKCISLDKRMRECVEKLSADEFGVYDKYNINLELYCDILDEYGIS